MDKPLDEKTVTWPPLKKALWDAITGEALNDGRYINAYVLTEKLYAAALPSFAAVQEDNEYLKNLIRRNWHGNYWKEVNHYQTDEILKVLGIEPQYEYLTKSVGRKSGLSHADVWPEGDDWEVDTTKGRVGTPDAGWERFDNHEELYFKRLKAS